jgi:large subunit ribosomal protein L15e
MYKYLKDAWKRPKDSYVQDVMRDRAIAWRKQPSVVRVDTPTRLDRAHSLGYKAKKGFVVVRSRVLRGGRRKLRPVLGRRQKRMGVTKFTAAKSKVIMVDPSHPAIKSDKDVGWIAGNKN